MSDDKYNYSTSAKYYDGVYEAKQDLQDKPFYLDLARKQGGPALEIACGTGRILLPTARLGLTIDGLDLSEPMLNVLRNSLARESAEVRSRVTVHRGDMRDFKLGKTYRLITIPFRPLQHLYTVEDQMSALRCAKNHLAPDGLLAFNVFFPRYDLLDSGFDTEQFEAEWPLPEQPGKTVRRYFQRTYHDKINQFFTGLFFYRVLENGKQIAEEREELKMCYYSHQQVMLLLKTTGLAVVEKYGGWDKRPMDNNTSEMIFVAKHG